MTMFAPTVHHTNACQLAVNLVVCTASAFQLVCSVPSAAAAEVTKASNAFATDIYRVLSEEGGNLVTSPFSIYMALGMSCAGARGETASEIATALYSGGSPQKIHLECGRLLKELTGRQTSGSEVIIANGLFAQNGYPFIKRFRAILEDSYNTTLQEIDLTGWPNVFDPAKATVAREKLNAWISGRTQNKITEMLPAYLPGEDTRLILANAIWFKGRWATSFDKKATTAAPFYVSSEETVSVPMMRSKSNFRYAESETIQVLELPYVSRRYSMLLFLPKQGDELAAIESSLTPAQIEQWLRECKRQEVRVSLPRFEMDSAFDLATPLRELGITRAFGSGADFSGITTEKPFFLTSAIHKARVVVDEEGTEAMAATSLAPGTIGSPPHFNANHPFIFVIRHNKTGIVLFIGRVVDPSKG